MPVLQCTNGHVTLDREAVRCPECGAPIVLRRGWRQDDTPQTSYAPFPPAAQLTLGLIMLGSAAVAFAMGVPLTLAVGAVLLIVGVGLTAGAVIRMARGRPRRRT